MDNNYDTDGWEVYDPSMWDSSEKANREKKGLDPAWIDLEDVRQWIYACDYEHGDTCNNTAHHSRRGSLLSYRTKHGRPLWLVDVVSECIVPADNVRYIALSYVWGDNVERTEATQENVGILLEPGSLNENNSNVIIPRTIRHAMQLVNVLGERYLWVDLLCIVQDDTESKHSQLSMMDHIFEGAYFTIVAANGWDANHGLRGIKGVTEPRHLSSEPEEEEEYMNHIDRETTPWYIRGWTFQEMFFARRRLYFLYQYVVWQCGSGVWHEATGTTGNLPAATDGGITGNKSVVKERFRALSSQRLREVSRGSDVNKVPPLRTYLEYIRKYNIRMFTYPEDGQNAFLGVINRMTDYFAYGFLWGLPIEVFDIALLWQPFEDMTRRKSKRGDAPQLPSWSWVGWQGLLHRDCWQEVYQSRTDPKEPSSNPEDPKPNHATLITPVCKFQCVVDGATIKIRTDYHADENEPVTSLTGQPNPILSVHAPVMTLKVSKQGWDMGAGFFLKDVQGYYHWICTPGVIGERAYCGLIFMQSALHTSLPDESECEFLVLSRATASLEKEPTWHRILYNYPLTEDLRAKGRFDYYNVLWIKRENDVAYRHALGKIAVAAWDSFSPAWEFVQLG
ncbi:HET-domain-containing protein [Poronia punctata]|nr:HET-domain-containing protein [Poronia punctata]